MRILDNPKTEYIFKAAVLEDQIREILNQTQDMPPEQANELMAQITDEVIPQLRQLNDEHFDNNPAINASLDEIAQAIVKQDLEACREAFTHFSDNMGENFGTCFV